MWAEPTTFASFVPSSPRPDWGGGRMLLGSVTAAAGEQNDGKDDEPYPVVVKQLAEAVVIHGVPPN